MEERQKSRPVLFGLRSRRRSRELESHTLRGEEPPHGFYVGLVEWVTAGSGECGSGAHAALTWAGRLRHDLGAATGPLDQQRARFAWVDDLLDAEDFGREDRVPQWFQICLELPPQRIGVVGDRDAPLVGRFDAALDW